MASNYLGDRWAFAKPSTPPTKRRVSLIAVITAFFMLSSVAALASVTTDQEDYAPGSVVTISGDNSDGVGYLAGETVLVEVSGPNGYSASCEGIADDNGAWSCQVTLWDSYLAWGAYTYVATGLTSGVVESGAFTDALNTGSFASDCTTAQDSFTTGATVCIKLTGLGSSASGTIKWWKPGLNPSTDTATRTTNYGPVSGNTTDSFAVSDCGTWNIRVTASAVTGGIPDFDDTFEVTSCGSSNTAPSVAFDAGQPSTANEGETKSFSFSITDPDADTWSYVTGFPDCDGGSLSNVDLVLSDKAGSFDCTFPDGPASEDVRVKVNDGTANSNVATTSVEVANVKPTISSLGAGSAASCGGNSTVTINFTDPAGSYDTYEADIDWGDSTSSNPQDIASGDLFSHVYASAGSHTVTVTVSDEDGGTSDEVQVDLVVNYNIAGNKFLQPVNDTRNGQSPSLFKYGSTVPLKLDITDCDGSRPNDLMIKVEWDKISGSTPNGYLESATATNNPDGGHYMRFTDPNWMFNWGTKYMSDPTCTVRIQATIMATGQVVYSDIGLRK